MKLLRFLLFPFAVLYDVITRVRNWFFNVGILKSTSFDIPVIAVGNLSVGGTGKSPQIEYLIRLLKDDYNTAVLSRGYKRKTEGFQLVNDKHTAEDVGDEPLQFYKKFKKDVTIAVDADRTNGIQQLLQHKNPPEVVLLDDAYQHRKVTASSYILLTKYNDLFVDDFVLPTGNLRESRRGAKRAKVIVVTKCPKNLSKTEQEKIVRKLNPKPYQKVFFTTIAYDENLKGTKELTIDDLQDKEVLLVTGIANPTPLLNFLKEKEVSYKHLNFPDHHNFTQQDILKIEKIFNELPSKQKIMLTTEKDYMRLEGKVDSLNYISIKSHFIREEKAFNSLMLDEIKKVN
ncbi:tetraacyldisaccharide 4'-kinase [Tenacibaculum singaporense]|uniref:tetraacyldisaccharide 4'-kinase n=1 Tax=Tenacibaculum singaporense TaxID=2358479 RepID=UPI000F68F69B|nr:tetraacyldisaccharide 4'-kinase [Tenacibaculum singaporense]RSC92779.1 tetraacyldisaccharide 4'-kinase [Tenacibaculum singaporense]GFD96436.1 tetraacyldisaccharide 4'-kinase [Alteromonas sp. KUL154]GFE02114.1 tetraacyldisaccharide 4'-kinase [Alteromonas sp. KUL156]